MYIKLKKNILYVGNYKLRCAIGKRGITDNKKEGDLKTPKGNFVFKSIFYREDRLSNLKCSIKKNIIKKSMGWCHDSSSKFYNKLIKFPFKKGAERLWLRQKIYNIILVINYNMKPIVKNKGSAIFLHIANKNYSPTKGCIAVSEKDILFLIGKVNRKTKLIID